MNNQRFWFDNSSKTTCNWTIQKLILQIVDVEFMFRKILLVFIFVAFGALVFFMYTRFNENKRTTQDYFAAIPYQVALIADIKSPQSFFKSITNSNLIYDEFKQIGWATNADASIKQLDSLIKKDPFFGERWESTRLVAALLPSGKDKHSWLFSVLIPRLVSDKNVQIKVKNLFGEQNLAASETYDGAKITSYQIGSNIWFTTVYKDFFLASKTKISIEDAIRQLNSGVSLSINHRGFKKVMTTAGLSKEVNFYTHQKYFLQYASKFLGTSGKNVCERLETFSGWTELDLIVKSNGLLFNGYSFAEDSLRGYLTIFNEQNTQNIDVTEILPASTAFFLHYGISDYKSYDRAYKNYLQVRNKLDTRDRAINQLKENGIDVNQLLEKHMVGEVALCISEIPTTIRKQSIGVIQSKSYGLIRIINKTAFLESMQPLMVSDGSADSLTTYREVDIFGLNYPGFMRQAFGQPYGAVACNYLMFVENYVVFGDQLASMRDFINNWKGNKTLAYDEHFDGFQENLSDQSNITMYSNVSRSPYLWHYFVNDNFADTIKNNVEFLRKFGGLSLQIERGKSNLYYNSIYFEHNPSYKKISSSLWEVPLDTVLATEPMPFTNHYTKAKDVVVQDASGKVYLISNTGRVLWSRAIGEPILGRVHEVDRYKNNKFQLLFNTASKVYLLDRNGKNVEGFPVALKNPIIQPLSVFDYDNNKKYRIFIAQKNGDIQCLDISGKFVNGWKYKRGKPIIKPILYTRLNKKDYLIAMQSNGQVKVLNRRGEKRIKLTRKMETYPNSTFNIKLGKGLSSSYITCSDSNGVVYRLSLKNKLETAQIKQSEGLGAFNFIDMNFDGKKDYCFIDNNVLKIYNSEFKLTWEYKSESPLSNSLTAYKVSNEDEGFMCFSDVQNKAYIFNEHQNQVQGSPFYGNGKALISDVNIDGRYELIIGSKEGSLYCYVLN